MRNICIIIFILSFNVTYCQSRIIGNGYSNEMSVSSNYQPEPAFQLAKIYANNGLESGYNRLQSAFQAGIIITNNGDTLSGLIKFASAVPSEKITYRQDSTASDSIFYVDKLKSVITQFAYFTNIPFKGKGTMMPWLAVGKINLFVHTKNYNIGPSDITYVLENDRNQFDYIIPKDFKVMMRHVFFDTPDMLEKIGKKGYKFDDMIRIIREYNERFR